MTDNGLAALATAIHVGRNHQHDPRADERPHAHLISEREQEEAAAILGPRGVFLPDGTVPSDIGMSWVPTAAWEEQAATIAALRVALDVRMVVQAINAVAKRHGVAKDPPERPLMHIFGYTSATPDMDAEIAAEYAALAAAEETE